MASDRPKVVIIGGGFGGLSLAQHLRNAPVDVTLIDRRNFHLFQPLMYQVATGSLSAGEVAAPLRSVLSRQRNVRVLLGDAVDVDPKDQLLLLDDGAKIPYDTLVVATGSQTSYFGHDEWRRFAECPKSIEESTEIRSKIFFAFEAAERAAGSPDVAAWLTFVIVGAGATGLEMAGALAEIARETLRHDFRSIQPQNARIILIELAPRVLPGYPEDLSRHARQLVERLGVEVLTGTRVLDITETAVTYENENGRTELATRTVLWAGGIAPTAFGERLARTVQAKTERSGRILVNPDLTLLQQPNIFVIGDLAAVAGKDGKPLPGLAPVAIQQGAYVAKVIRARLRGRESVPPFRYFNRGDMAVIGRAAAVANVFGFHFWGLPAWLLWLFIHLMYIVEFQSRVLVFIEWGFLYLTWSRGARLITCPAPPDESL
jgi:NADH:ubiquinone reductase (H+-translocating)